MKIRRSMLLHAFRYYLTWPHIHGNGIRDSFLFRTVNKVFAKDIDKEIILKIESYRKSLLHSDKLIEITDFGAAGKGKIRQEKISAVARTSPVNLKYGKLLYRLVHEFQPSYVLELGTSLGVSTLFLASAHPKALVCTLEGSESKAAIALEAFRSFELDNIELIQGNFDEKLPEILAQREKPDFVFIDGNHRYAPTVNYFNQFMQVCADGTIFVVDDIHWSEEMEKAWGYIQQHPRTSVCFDLFRLGIVFINSKLQKQNLTVFY